jgi:hypothetical protein
MNEPYNLDSWDIETIQYVKENQKPTLTGIKTIWAERCALDVGYVQFQDIAVHLLRLCERLKLSNLGAYLVVDIALRLSPSKEWELGFNFLNNNTFFHNENDKYWARVTAVMASVFMNADMKDLPGYTPSENYRLTFSTKSS